MHSFEGFGIRALEASSALDAPTPQVVIDQGELRVASVSVPHGMMPSVAYRIDQCGASVVFSGDVQTAHAPLVGLAAGCDLLVHDLALPERETEHDHLHAKASEVGQVARDCDCRRLLVTHVMPELENELDDALELVRRAYSRELVVAEDLMRVVVWDIPIWNRLWRNGAGMLAVIRDDQLSAAGNDRCAADHL